MKNKKSILLRPRELADIYALKTIYDYLITRDLNVDTSFYCYWRDVGSKGEEILSQLPRFDSELVTDSVDLVLSSCSDIGSGSIQRYKNLEIDICLFKNSVIPMTEREKYDIKLKYDINTKKPIVVISYVYLWDKHLCNTKRLIKEFCDKSSLYLIDICDSELESKKIPYKIRKKVNCVDIRGILKDYYAIADITIDGNYVVADDSRHLHNFIEATEGGPLFIIEPRRTTQYGYKALIKSGVIRKCIGIEDMIEKINEELNNPTKEEHFKKRNAHLKKTREKYLPIIESYITHILFGSEKKTSNLKESIINDTTIRLMHPETKW